MDILKIIKSKNPEEVTTGDLSTFQLVIEESINHLNVLQHVHRELTGKIYVPSIRL